MSDSVFSPAEEQATKEFINRVNDIRLLNKSGPMSFETAVKFMMARKFDVKRALELYQNHENVRFTEGLTRFDVNAEPLKTELETGKFTVLPSRDKSGAIITMFTAYKHSPTATSHKATLQGVVYQLDVALEDEKTQRSGIVFIYNMSSSKYSNFDYELSQKILSLLKGAYPARLKNVYIVTAPLWFKAPFKILRLFVREKLRDRVFMVNSSQLHSHIPPEALPVELGGKLVLNHLSWLMECHKSAAKNSNELCDLASHNKFPLIIHKNGAIEDSQNSNGNLSDEEESASSEVASKDENSTNGDQSGNHAEANQVVKQPLGKRPSKPKPDKIIMPKEPLFEDDEKKPSFASSDVDIFANGFLHSEEDEGLTIEEFIQYMKQKSRKGLYDEYNEIKSKYDSGSFDNSRLRSNHHKNRYTDVLCYDHSRVLLSIEDDDPNSDYINANFVDGYMQKRAFISTQGPLPKTSTDFWKMIWEQQVVVIVMTTKTIERCRAKCHQYWPFEAETTAEYGPFEIHNRHVEQFPDYMISQLEITDSKSGTKRDVTHMQYTSWPDYGCPPTALGMLEFRDKVRQQQVNGTESLGSEWQGHSLGPPIVVHCSAGIGRTGTFITLDISIMRLEATAKIDIKRTVEKIRGQRAHSIQMPDQYVFCYLALLEFALSRRLLEEIDLSGFDESESETED
ncbi:Tyrosine-protein phosphatase non-receptor type 9 [Halotydeus destructor]|nr:Tyrosine-protein phosphatase non-receptor type 9 [Halotydeus destructor]